MKCRQRDSSTSHIAPPVVVIAHGRRLGGGRQCCFVGEVVFCMPIRATTSRRHRRSWSLSCWRLIRSIRLTTTTATTAGTTMMTMDSTASSCGHGCALLAWAAAAAAAESMLRQQRQLGTRDSDGNGNGNGAVAAGQRQWWQ